MIPTFLFAIIWLVYKPFINFFIVFILLYKGFNNIYLFVYNFIWFENDKFVCTNLMYKATLAKRHCYTTLQTAWLEFLRTEVLKSWLNQPFSCVELNTLRTWSTISWKKKVNLWEHSETMPGQSPSRLRS